MSAIRLDEPGDVSRLHWHTDALVPSLQENEVLIRTKYAGVNFMDTHFRSGRYPAAYPLILGGEGAGVIAAAYPSVENEFRPGDRVAYLAKSGAYAEYNAVSADRVVHLPEHISLEAAAACFAQGLTAVTLVREAHVVKPGEWILIHGASGGVGSLLVQICAATGAKVLATVSSNLKARAARDRGAEFVIDTSTEEWVARVGEITGGHGVDAIFDPIGQATFDGNLEAIAKKGDLVCFGNASGQIPPVNVLRLGGTKNIKLCYPTVFAYLNTREETQGYADDLFEMVRTGVVKVDGYTLDDVKKAGTAHEELEGRKAGGKIVLQIP
ncbi:hypothetical protein PFICI_01656 [Pestalotiopsis fici W106-1]|uniref:Probable quinone oxidoreductase n=1 Tax=Pestalotiopsis fici (strain W106-1 / CGMCC3.15140) TaxID=1229662 RepID=W3XP42_PESFW|nr:uncharacterized protein PFICI_01656 [Pestalotiopsis fici W106-1]ETS87828.1 hypothetical protein PFICI_01656 [Pestalotiopsis fici W106-1]